MTYSSEPYGEDEQEDACLAEGWGERRERRWALRPAPPENATDTLLLRKGLGAEIQGTEDLVSPFDYRTDAPHEWHVYRERDGERLAEGTAACAPAAESAIRGFAMAHGTRGGMYGSGART